MKDTNVENVPLIQAGHMERGLREKIRVRQDLPVSTNYGNGPHHSRSYVPIDDNLSWRRTLDPKSASGALRVL